MSLAINSPENDQYSDEFLLKNSVSKPWLFSVLIDRYEAAFTRKVFGILRDQNDVEEVVLDTFTKIYFNAATFSPQDGAKFSSWAYRILLNTAFTRYQKLVKEGKRFSSLDPEFEQFVADNNSSSDNEIKDMIDRILSKIPTHFAYVLRLHYLEHWSHQDIAESTNEKVGTIKARIHRAKESFRRESQNNGIDISL